MGSCAGEHFALRSSWPLAKGPAERPHAQDGDGGQELSHHALSETLSVSSVPAHHGH